MHSVRIRVSLLPQKEQVSGVHRPCQTHTCAHRSMEELPANIPSGPWNQSGVYTGPNCALQVVAGPTTWYWRWTQRRESGWYEAQASTDVLWAQFTDGLSGCPSADSSVCWGRSRRLAGQQPNYEFQRARRGRGASSCRTCSRKVVFSWW